MTDARSGTEESRERKIALFWTLVRAFESGQAISQEEIVRDLMIDELPVRTKVPRRKLAYEGSDNALRQKFERDKAAIRDLGFEIATIKDDYGRDGYWIDPATVFVPTIDFTEDELRRVAWATRLLGLSATGVGRLFSDGPADGGGAELSPYLQPLMRAQASRRLALFDYRSASGKTKPRAVAVLDLLWFRGQPYVIGVDQHSQSVKGFKVARIQSVPQVTESVVAPSAELAAAAARWVPSGDDPDETTVRLTTSPGYARVLRAQYANDVEVVRDDEGAVELAIEFNGGYAARRAVLAMGDHVWSVRPRSLRDELHEWLSGVGRGDRDVTVPTFSASGTRRDTLGQTLQLIAAVYQSPEPVRASELAARCAMDVELVRSIMSRVMSLQYVRDPTQYLVAIELGEDVGDDDPDDPLYARSADYDDGLGAAVAPLTWRDAFELLVALKEVEELHPSDVGRSVVDKIERTVNAHVRVQAVSTEHLSVVRDAIDRGEQMKISYWTASRDEVSDRWVQPRAMASRQGRWYFRAYCATRNDWLTFRVDRILHVHAVGPATPPRPDEVVNWVDDGHDEGALVVVALPASARWLVEPLPIDGLAELADGRLAVRLRVRDERFLEQLLVDAGPGSVVLVGPKDAGRELARRMMRQI